MASIGGVSDLNFNTDLDEIEALNQKRTLAFINHWVYNTILFLNQFSRICQQKLLNLEAKLRRANDLLSTLESKLSSIPGLDDVEASTSSCNQKEANSNTDVPQSSVTTEVLLPRTQTQDSPNQEVTGQSNVPLEKTTVLISTHPVYAPYFKMANVGVPRDAVKLKMKASGIDPALLDDPTLEVEYTQPDNPDSD